MSLTHQYGSLGVPQTPKRCDALIEIFKFIRYVFKKLHVCSYSTIRFTLRFVNLFVKVSRVCAIAPASAHGPIRLQAHIYPRTSEGMDRTLNLIIAIYEMSIVKGTICARLGWEEWSVGHIISGTE